MKNHKLQPMCCARIPYGQMARTRPCKCAGTIERDGKHYCSTHDPLNVDRRMTKRDLTAQAKLRVKRLQARAPQMKGLLLAIKDRCTNIHHTDQVTGQTFSDLIDKVLEGT